MKAQNLLAKDTKISLQMAEKVITQLQNIVSDSQSATELGERINAATPNGKIQFIVLSGLINMTEEAGKHRGGTPTLTDQILDRQASQVKRYGENAYKLSEKQVEAISRDAWSWLRPEMRQGA